MEPRTKLPVGPAIERRRTDGDPADALSPECLALLVSCGDRIRASDPVSSPPQAGAPWQREGAEPSASEGVDGRLEGAEARHASPLSAPT